MGAWSWILISSRAPKIYTIQPVIAAICSDFLNLIRNFRRLFSLSTEISKGILNGSVDIENSSNPKLFEGSLATDIEETNKESNDSSPDKALDAKRDQKVNTQENAPGGKNVRSWFGKFIGITEKKDLDNDLEPTREVESDLAVDGAISEEPTREVESRLPEELLREENDTYLDKS